MKRIIYLFLPLLIISASLLIFFNKSTYASSIKLITNSPIDKVGPSNSCNQDICSSLLTLINEAKQALNKKIYRVEGEAQKILTEAEGYAIERVNEAKGDVALFQSVLKEYLKAPQITKDRLYIEMMDYVLTNNHNKIIVDKDIENLVPLLDQNKMRIK